MTQSVVILAAGVGKRLRPLTSDRPKSLLPVGGRPLLYWQLDALRDAGLDSERVHVMAGHCANRFEEAALGGARVHYYPDYEQVNNIGTLGFALERVEPPVLIVNSDTMFARRHLECLGSELSESALLYDPLQPPRAEAMKIRMIDNRLAEISKSIDSRMADGEYIGVARIAADAHALLREVCQELAEKNPNLWYEDAFAELCGEVDFNCRSIGELPWIEIDSHDDLAAADQMVAADPTGELWSVRS